MKLIKISHTRRIYFLIALGFDDDSRRIFTKELIVLTHLKNRGLTHLKNGDPFKKQSKMHSHFQPCLAKWQVAKIMASRKMHRTSRESSNSFACQE
jgi:hypothetical protein